MNLSDFQTSTGAGEAVLAQALALAQKAWGGRLVAAYALGSLAHGGFSEHVSDVDFAVVLADPLEPSDAERIAQVAAAVKAGGAPLSDRLSVFWGSPQTIAAKAEGGRFPPVDLVDLKEHGRLMAGRDVRAVVALPQTKAMVIAAARQAIKSMATPEATEQLHHPESLVQAGARSLTKRILFPVRFLYTAQTGKIGRNDAAVTHFLETQDGAAAELARAAFEWRYRPYSPGDGNVLDLVRRGVLPLYRLFADDYEARLRGWDAGMARGFAEWRQRL